MNPSSFETNKYGGVRSLKVDLWIVSQSIVNNQTVVGWKIRGAGTNTSAWYTTKNIHLYLDGKLVYTIGTGSINLTGTIVVASGETTVQHTSDGSKTMLVRLEGTISNYGTYQTATGNSTITSIPRFPVLSLTSVTRQLNKLSVSVSNTRVGTITSWEVRRVSDGGLITSGTSSTPAFDLTGLSPNTNYNGVYKIRAYANGGWGDYLTLNIGLTNALPTFSVTNFDVGEKPKITLTNLNNITNYEIKVKDGSTVIKTISNITTNNYEVTLSSGELTTILNNHPNDITIGLNYLVTVTSNSLTYSLNNPTGNMVIPDALYKPTFTIANVAYSDQNSVSNSLTCSNQKIIKGISNVKFTIQPMTANGGATAVKYQITSGSISNTGNHTSLAIDVLLNSVNAGTASITAIDSRGKTTTITLTYSQFVDYSSPTISSYNIRRKDGVTENLLFDISGIFTNWTGLSTTNNIQSIQYRYKEKGTSVWSSYITISGTTYSGSNYYLTNILTTGNLFDITKEYDIDINITDKLSTVIKLITVPSGQPFIWKDLLGKLFGIGKKPAQALDVAGDINTDGNFRKNGSIWNHKLECYPVGAIYMSTVSTSPDTLFGGTWVSWGIGRVPVSVNTGDGAINIADKIGGSTNPLTSHTHSQNSHHHVVTSRMNPIDGANLGSEFQLNRGDLVTGGLYYNLSAKGTTNDSIASDKVGALPVTATNNYTGDNTNHNNWQPFITCYMWKRTA